MFMLNKISESESESIIDLFVEDPQYLSLCCARNILLINQSI